MTLEVIKTDTLSIDPERKTDMTVVDAKDIEQFVLFIAPITNDSVLAAAKTPNDKILMRMEYLKSEVALMEKSLNEWLQLQLKKGYHITSIDNKGESL